jgi:hypothetical protein
MRTVMDKELEEVLTEAVSIAGRKKVIENLQRFKASKADDRLTLSIIVNSGIHYLPPEYLRGEIFVASKGSLDLSSDESIREVFRGVLMRTARKLKSRQWQRVYVIPFGPTPLSMQIKLLVYRICGIETIDVMNVPGRPRIDLAFDLRQLVVDSEELKE